MGGLSTPTRPLRRGSSFAKPTSKPQFRSKFSVSYEALLAGEHPWLNTPGSSSSSSLSNTPIGSSASNQASSYFSASGKKPSAPRVRFFADLLCLKVEPKTVESLLGAVSARQLTDDDEISKGARIRDNIGSLWRECLRVWADVPNSGESGSPLFSAPQVNISDEVRRANAIDTLVEISKNILAKSFTHSPSSLDLIWIFAGGIDEADDVFEELVDAIDAGLRGELDNVMHLRRTARPNRLPSSPDQDASLQQQRNASLNRPDELPTLRELLHHRIGAVHLAIIWISHASTTNLSAYFVRRDLFVGACSLLNTIQSILRTTQAQQGRPGLGDVDAELLRVVVRDTMLLIGLLAGLGHTATSGIGIGGSSKAMEASSSPYFRRMCDWVDSGSMDLLRDALSVDLEQAWRAYEVEASSEGQAGTGGLSSSLGSVTEGLRKMAMTAEGVVDLKLPPTLTSSLLPIYLLCRANQVFIEVAMTAGAAAKDAAETGEGRKKPSFAAALISLSSFLTTHGALNDRSRSYSRLALLIPLTLLASPAGVSSLVLSERVEDIAAIRLCTQRSGPLSMRSAYPSEQSGSLTNFFTQFTSHGSAHSSISSRKRLLPFVFDTCVQFMRHNLRKRLDTSGYLICLQTILLAIQTCAERRVELEYSEWPDLWATISSMIVFLVGRHTELRGVEIGKLGQALLSLLSLALLESDRFLPSRRDTNVLIYELVRNGEAVRRLASIVATGTDLTMNQQGGSGATIGSAKASDRATATAMPMWRLLDLTLMNFDDKLREWTDKRSGRSMFGLSLSISTLTPSFLGGGSTASPAQDVAASANSSEKGSRPSSSGGPGTPNGAGYPSQSPSRRMPDVQTVLELISSLDMEQITHKFQMESEGSGLGSVSSSTGDGSRFSSIARKGALIDEEWLERAESQCLAEAFRYASEDMRLLIASS